MAEPLKNQYGPEVPRRIGSMLAGVDSTFPQRAFVRAALQGYEALELMPRARHILRALHAHLPRNYERAIDLLLASLGPKLQRTDNNGMAPFLYLPHVLFVAEHGLGHLETSLRAQYELTQRFTAEFSIRAFLEHHQAATLARLHEWTADPSPHVRRLVSEGTRPRLPWAARLREFQRDPRPVLELLEKLKDDHELYVRRSVANNLNDIGKDHPELLVKTAQRWMKQATPHRTWIVGHALRSAVKRGEPGALSVLGYGGVAKVEVSRVRISPKNAAIGDAVTVEFQVANPSARRQRLLVDLRVHFVKAKGGTSAKVFKLRQLDLDAGETAQLRKRLSLREMTTRQHYPGVHAVEALVNGRPHVLGNFRLRA